MNDTDKIISLDVEEDDPTWMMTASTFRGQVTTLRDRGVPDKMIRNWVDQVLDPNRNCWITR